MSRKPYTFTLQITLQAPYLVHGNDPGRWGLDTTLLRNAHGCPILPGTLITGRVADVWLNHNTELGNPNLNDWLGQLGNGPLAADGGQRARLRVADLKLTKIGETPWSDRAEQPLTQTRIALDGDTGSVQRGAMLVAEQLAAPGTPLHFEGAWHAWATEEEASSLANQLQAALRAQTQIGADRSVGFGVLIQASVTAQPATTPQEDHVFFLRENRPELNAKLRLRLQFSEHFCITQRLHNGNLFKGSDTVPGGAVLGALAQTLCQAHGVSSVADLRERSALARHFDALHCSHAHPALQTQTMRPVPIPCSWVSSSAGLRDSWRWAQPVLADGKAPAFQPDWKATDFTAAQTLTGWANVPRHLRVRTALQDGQARNEHLFAYEARYSPLGDQALHWLADLDLPPGIPSEEQQALLQELHQLTHAGLGPIGKTDAQASVTWVAAAATVLMPPEAATPDFRPGDLIALRLNSPALLLHAQALADQAIGSAAQAYTAAFDDLLKQAGATGALRYSHHFARERLVGGSALQHRYRLGQTQPNIGAYQPLLLTEAGAVFVFIVQRSSDVHRVLHKWELSGLPLPTPVAKVHGSTWQDHPYIPANGYGEICLHASHPQVPDLPAA